MIDYVQPEIVLPVADNTEETVIFVYGGENYEFYKNSYFVPNLKNDMCVLDSINGKGSLGFLFKNVASNYDTIGNLSEYYNELNDDTTIHYSVSSTIVQCYIAEYGPVTNGTIINRVVLDTSDSVRFYGSSPYVAYKALNFFGTIKYGGYFTIPEEYFPQDYIPPVIDSITIDGSDIYWLYNFGRFLASSGNRLDDILNFRIGSTNLITLIFAGFTVYMGWTIIKWAIPS